MRRRSRSTAPELAAATGLSLVTIHKELRRLCTAGEIRKSREQRTRGGRPAPIYEYEARYACCVRLQLSRSGSVLQAMLEVVDMQGRVLSRQQSTYAALERESLDGMLDSALHGRRVASIALIFSPALQREDVRAHLQQRYRCRVVSVNPAAALADEREGTATLYLPRQAAPQCCLRRDGKLLIAGQLELLPLPGRWESLDYGDHTLVEEMVARLLLIIICTLAPERIVLHADFWTTRLTDRIRYNAGAKLRGAAAPVMQFAACSAEQALYASMQYDTRPGHLAPL